jgi:quinolinate synthase
MNCTRNTLQQQTSGLKTQRNAAITAHDCQSEDVKDIADFEVDSADLSSYEVNTQADVIIFCSVQFYGRDSSYT